MDFNGFAICDCNYRIYHRCGSNFFEKNFKTALKQRIIIIIDVSHAQLTQCPIDNYIKME
jgi:hypothetical protein